MASAGLPSTPSFSLAQQSTTHRQQQEPLLPLYTSSPFQSHSPSTFSTPISSIATQFSQVSERLLNSSFFASPSPSSLDNKYQKPGYPPTSPQSTISYFSKWFSISKISRLNASCLCHFWPSRNCSKGVFGISLFLAVYFYFLLPILLGDSFPIGVPLTPIILKNKKPHEHSGLKNSSTITNPFNSSSKAPVDWNPSDIVTPNFDFPRSANSHFKADQNSAWPSSRPHALQEIIAEKEGKEDLSESLPKNSNSEKEKELESIVGTTSADRNTNTINSETTSKGDPQNDMPHKTKLHKFKSGPSIPSNQLRTHKVESQFRQTSKSPLFISPTREEIKLKFPKGSKDTSSWSTWHSEYMIVLNEPFSKSRFELSPQLQQGYIREAMRHAWQGYYDLAFPKDELKNGAGVNSFGGYGATVIDSIDTLWLLGLVEEYNQAKAFVERLNWKEGTGDGRVIFFESSIRYLGGLLSAFTLTGESIFLCKAEELGDAMLPGFDVPGTPGFPPWVLNLKTGAREPHNQVPIAEVSSIQLEFKYLSYLTDRPIFHEKVEKIMEVIDSNDKDGPGLYPSYMDNAHGRFTNSMVTANGLEDSFFEYLLKQYLLSGKSEDRYLKMYTESVHVITEKLMVSLPGYSPNESSDNSQKAYIGDLTDGVLEGRMEHLACFVPAMLTLSSLYLDRKQDLPPARAIVNGCLEMYETPTGLAGDVFSFDTKDLESGLSVRGGEHQSFMLRPETVESLFYLWRATKDPIYRQKGWDIFLAIEKHSKIVHGYAGVLDVMNVKSPKDSFMRTWFLAETIKYLWLLFAPDDVLPLDEYVFNTEAHPFKIWHP